MATCTLEFDSNGNKVRDVTVNYIMDKPAPNNIFRGWWEDWGEDGDYDL